MCHFPAPHLLTLIKLDILNCHSPIIRTRTVPWPKGAGEKTHSSTGKTLLYRQWTWWDISIPIPACCLSVYGESRVWKSLEHLQSLSHAFRWILICLASPSQSHALAQIYVLPERWHSICQLQFSCHEPGLQLLEPLPFTATQSALHPTSTVLSAGAESAPGLRCAHQVFSLEPSP